MSARGFSIVALGAALVALIVFNVFRSDEPGSAGSDTASDSAVTAQGLVEGAGSSGSANRRPDAMQGQKRNAAAESQPVPLPPPGPYASISAALADQDLPPERRMQPVPELLETERAFAAEGVDPPWSTAAEGAVLRRIAEIPAVAYASLNVECRTTLCLLQFVQSATPAPNSGIVELTNLFKSEGLKPGWMIGIRVRSGAAVGIAYLERDDSAAAQTGVSNQ